MRQRKTKKKTNYGLVDNKTHYIMVVDAKPLMKSLIWSPMEPYSTQ